MLHIILLILKIIGIILLCILGILLLSILCVLFVPVRYRIEVTREEGEGKPPFTARIKITWLLHLINIRIRYPGDVIVRVRLLLFTVFRMPEKEKRGEHSKRARHKKQKRVRQDEDHKQEGLRQEAEISKEEENKEIQESSVQWEQTPGEQRSDRQPEYKNTPTASAQGEEAAGIPVDTVSSPAVLEEWNRWDTDITHRLDAMESEASRKREQFSGSEEDSGFTAKIRRLPRTIKEILSMLKLFVVKIKSFFENIQYTIRKFCDKIRSMLDNIQYYREVLESDTFKQSVALCKAELGAVLNGLRPDRFETDLIVGMGDPAVTGGILAFFGVLYPLIGLHVRIVGDFESEKLRVEGRVYIRGRIRGFTFLRTAVRVYFNKDIRTMIKQLKKEAA